MSLVYREVNLVDLIYWLYLEGLSVIFKDLSITFKNIVV